MNKDELIKKIISKKEFSHLLMKDVERVFNKFDKDIYSDEEKIKFSRDLLRKIFSGFASGKLMSLKNKSEEWILKKHLSTKERYPYYKEVYERLFRNLPKKVSVIDLGAGVNGFSYKFFPREISVNYIGVEAIGQIVSLMNDYFKKNNIHGIAVHETLFESQKIKDLIKNINGKKLIFLFKTVDSLEMLERNYSKRLLKEITLLADRIVVSFATESMVKRRKFAASRDWIVRFIGEEFRILDDFEVVGERYVIFEKK